MLNRRQLLTAGGVVVAAAFTPRRSHAQQTLLPPTCSTPLDPILGWNNIPEYKSECPKRTSLLAPGIDFWGKEWPGSPSVGERLILTGRVLTTRCEPIANARLEFWHTDAKGLYDYAGFNFRGLQNADKDGNYRLETVMPGYYNPRRHIHYLVGVRLDQKKSGILVTDIIGLPTDDEFKSGEADATIPPRAFTRENGVLTAPHDFVIAM